MMTFSLHVLLLKGPTPTRCSPKKDLRSCLRNDWNHELLALTRKP